MADEFVKVLSASLTPLVALFAVYIAWQQYQIARDKLKLDLFDRRYGVYRGLMDFFAVLVNEPNVTLEHFGQFYAATDRKRFLFGNEVVEYLSEVRRKGLDMRQIQRQLFSNTLNETDRNKAIENEREIIEWLEQQIDGLAAQKFGKYLDFQSSL